MKYPDDFNTPAFPAGKFVAVSRFMATSVMLVFFAIVCLCGMILWLKKSQDVSPFLISISPNGERWTVVAHNNHKTTIPAYYVLQESLLNKFIEDWFTISDDIFLNKANWADCSMNTEVCTQSNGDNIDTCAIYCACNNAVYDNFSKVVLPVYSKLESEQAATWTIKNISIKPVYPMGSITEYGGFWKMDVLVQTNLGFINFVGYARVERDSTQYPKTMGYYVSEFNTYRMN